MPKVSGVRTTISKKKIIFIINSFSACFNSTAYIPCLFNNVYFDEYLKILLLLRYNSLPCGTECYLGRPQDPGQRPRKMDVWI